MCEGPMRRGSKAKGNKMLLETTTYLGPARIVETAASYVRLALPDQEVTATLALSSPHRPAVGDVVLAIGHEEKFYVLGVIVGTAKKVFTAPGDLAFRARGKIDFVATEGVRISSARVTVQAGKLELVARSVVERFGDVWRRIKGVFQSRAGRVRHVVDGSYNVKAERIVERATKDVKIDGEKINLG